MKGGLALEYHYILAEPASDQSLSSGLSNTNVTLAVATNRLTEGSMFDRPNGTDFRALVACAARVTYNFSFQANTAETGFRIDGMLNGASVIPQSVSSSSARVAPEYKAVKKTFIVELGVNEYINFRLSTLEILTTLTVLSLGSNVSIEFVRRL